MKAKRNQFVPRCDALEARCVPALTWYTTGAKLWLVDNAGASDHLIIHDNGSGNVGNVTIQRIGVDNSPIVVPGNISQIDVRTRGGNDVVRYQLDSTLVANNRDVQVYLGSGSDRFVGALYGQNPDGSGVSLAPYTSHRIIAWGGTGYDVLRGQVLGDLATGSTLGFSLNGASEYDYWADIFDDIHVTATNDVDIASGATMWMNLWGREGDDHFFINYRGELDGRLLMHLEGGNGPDMARVTFTLDAGSTGSVGDPAAPNTFQGNWNRFVDIYGENGIDDLRFDVFNNGSATVLARIFGGADNDLLSGTPNVSKFQ